MKRRNWKGEDDDDDDDSDAPKTCEYAYFKKLKTQATLINSNFDKSSNDTAKSTGGSNHHANANHLLRPLVFAKSNLARNVDSFALPSQSHGGASKLSENKSKGVRDRCNIEKMTRESVVRTPRTEGTFSIVNKSKESYPTVGDMFGIDKTAGEFTGPLKTQGTWDRQGEIFTRKRRKLLQQVIETSFPEKDELNIDRNDLVSMLLSRLHPRRNDDDAFWTPKSWKVYRNTKHLSASIDSEVQKSQQVPSRNLTGAESSWDLDFGYVQKSDQVPTRILTGAGSSWDFDFGLPRSKRTRSRVLPDFNSTPCHDLRSLEYNIEEPIPELRGRTTFPCIESDYDFGQLDFCTEAFRPSATALTMWDNGHLLTLDNNDSEVDCTYGLRASSVISSFHPNFISFSPSHSANYQRHDYDTGKHAFEDIDCHATDRNHLQVHRFHRAIDISNIDDFFDDFSSSYCHLPISQEKPCPLLLEKSYWDSPEDGHDHDHKKVDKVIGYQHWMLPWKS